MSDATPITMDIQRILSILPHRYPFLLVDRVLECVPGSHIKAYKNVTINEPFFQGHFPLHRIFDAHGFQLVAFFPRCAHHARRAHP